LRTISTFFRFIRQEGKGAAGSAAKTAWESMLHFGFITAQPIFIEIAFGIDSVKPGLPDCITGMYSSRTGGTVGLVGTKTWIADAHRSDESVALCERMKVDRVVQQL